MYDDTQVSDIDYEALRNGFAFRTNDLWICGFPETSIIVEDYLDNRLNILVL